MKRRNFLGALAAISGTAISGSAYVALKSTQASSVTNSSFVNSNAAASLNGHTSEPLRSSVHAAVSPILEDAPASAQQMSEAIVHMVTPSPSRLEYLDLFAAKPVVPDVSNEAQLSRYLDKMQNFEAEHQEDVFLDSKANTVLVDSFKRIDRVQTLVGHGNFNVLGFDSMLKYARRNNTVGAFTKTELEFLEGLFFDDVERYGFFGEKVIDSLTAVVNERDRVKVSRTGHFLFRGRSQEVYENIRRDLGDNVVLTSGIRGIVKQTHLFLAKTIQSEGNLSLASRSLAPPGHSFHGIGDFDVGKRGFGAKNFTADFSTTEEYKRLVDLGYLDMRYPEQNLLGVRFEPWHIKVA